MLLPGKNMNCTKALVDEAGDDPDGVLIAEAPEIITVSPVEDFNTDHVIYGFVGKFYFPID